MKVLVTTNTLGIGGAERQRVLLANGLFRQGFAVDLLCLQGIGPMSSGLDAGVVLRRQRPTVTVLIEERADVVITGVTRTEMLVGMTMRRSGRARKWVAASHHAFPDRPGQRHHRYPRDLARCLGFADVVVALSEGHGRHLMRSTAAKNVAVVANGLPSVAISNPRVVESGLTEFAFVGRITEQKGLGPFLAAWEESQAGSSVLKIYGDGPLTGSLQDGFAAARNVSWEGATNDPLGAIARSDWLVVPSLWEAFPMVILESLAVGTPVLASRVGAVGEMLDGLPMCAAVEPGRSAWIDLIRRHDGKRTGFQDELASHVNRRYSAETMVSSYMALLEN
ncbi:glycosyltransferase [Pseudofrankia sp. DC12]|uniref:glycosyltransferase n=1 Tax=Pseudofrankia sp. DC12 TaxID=683315 RepID=UPI000A04D628|nr:glycosyltransferase [Pseudofrankia sp. DC12]